jgi:hypothetical protein
MEEQAKPIYVFPICKAPPLEKGVAILLPPLQK